MINNRIFATTATKIPKSQESNLTVKQLSATGAAAIASMLEAIPASTPNSNQLDELFFTLLSALAALPVKRTNHLDNIDIHQELENQLIMLVQNFNSDNLESFVFDGGGIFSNL